MATERTFAMLKPGVLHRRIAGDVISRIERKGLRIIALKMMNISRERAEQHYGEHIGKPFYPPLLEYMTSGPVVAMIIEGEDAISALRRLAGPTDPTNAPPGTIRGDYAAITRKNIVHASDSPESAEREIGLFFEQKEMYPWEDGNAQWF